MTTKDDERRAFFDSRAAGWENQNYPDETKERVAALVATLKLEKGARVLDVGCGTGILIPYLREAVGFDGQIIALDPSEPMLNGAAAKDGGRATLLRAAAESIPLISAYVDVLVCFAAFPHFSDKVAAAAEFFRVLRPGGRMVVAHLKNRGELIAHHRTHRAVAGDVLPQDHAMHRLFLGVGFVRTQLEERAGWYFFSAEKDPA